MPLSERVAEQVSADLGAGRRRSYVVIYAGEDSPRSTWIVAKKLEEMGVCATVGTCVTRDGRCIEITYKEEKE